VRDDAEMLMWDSAPGPTPEQAPASRPALQEWQ
jgi:hypothetical protein